MPFDSDKQRRYLFSQKPEVAKQIAHMQEGGYAMDSRKPKKVTQKDRYGNQVTFEYQDEVKPLDINSLLETFIGQPVPEMMEIPNVPILGDVSVGFADAHPGQPRGTDTIPAWLTPGEFVVNAEAMSDPQNAAMVEAINDEGRAMQEGGDVMIPYYQDGGEVMPMPLTEALLRAREGYRPDVYLDSLKKPTVGHGHLLPEEYKNRVGETPFSEEELDKFFEEDIATAQAAAQRNAEKYGVNWDDLSRREQTALASQAFQLGETGQGKFEKMWTKLAAGDKEGAALEALDSRWAEQTPTRAKDLYSAFQPGLGFQQGGPVYAYRGYDTAMQDAFDIEDPNADLGAGWTPPVYEADEISPMEQAILDQEAAGMDAPMPTPPSAMGIPDESSGEIPEGGGDFWSGIADWVTDTSVADERNAAFNVKATEANAEAAEETLAELQERVENGQPVNSHTLEQAEQAVEHTQEELNEARQEVGDIDYEGVVAGEAALMAEQVLKGPANDEPDEQKETLETAATDPEMTAEDNPSKESDKGVQSEEEVEAEGKKAPKEMVEKAKGFFTDAFSELFDGGELAKMAILYAGSRMLGYSHGGSLNWAAKNYLNTIQTNQANHQTYVQDLAKSGKYTSASVAAYKESKDLSDLVPAGSPVNRTGNFKTFYKNGKAYKAEELKQGDQTVWMTPDGRQIDATFQDDPARVKGTKEYDTRVKNFRTVTGDQLKSLRNQFDRFGEGENVNYKTDINPHTSAGKIAEWAADNNVDPNELAGLVESAYHDAINDNRQDGSRARDLVPYLNQLVIRHRVGGNADAFLAKGYEGDGPKQYVNASKLATLNAGAAGVLRSMGKEGDTDDLANLFYNEALRDWNDLGPDAQKKWNRNANDDESGFYLFATDMLTNWSK